MGAGCQLQQDVQRAHTRDGKRGHVGTIAPGYCKRDGFGHARAVRGRKKRKQNENKRTENKPKKKLELNFKSDEMNGIRGLHDTMDYALDRIVEPESRKVICFRGAGLLAYYFFGAWQTVCEVPELKHFFRNCQLRGISSGALVATLLAFRVPMDTASLAFHAEVEKERHRTWETRPGRWYLRAGRECKLRFDIVPAFVRTVLRNDDQGQGQGQGSEGIQVREVCGKLCIAVFSFRTMSVIYNDQWRNVDHIIEWLLGAMTIPFVTSGPRIVTTFDGERHLVMDAFNFDVLRGMRWLAVFWRFCSRLLSCLGRLGWVFSRLRPALVSVSVSTDRGLLLPCPSEEIVVNVTPIENVEGMRPLVLFPVTDVLRHRDEQKHRLIFDIGRVSALRFWLRRLEHNLYQKYLEK